MRVLQLSKKYGNDRLEKACRRAKALGSCTYTTIKNILKNGKEDEYPEMPKPTPEHENIRGGVYYS
jgi:hypothetical protein